MSTLKRGAGKKALSDAICQETIKMNKIVLGQERVWGAEGRSPRVERRRAGIFFFYIKSWKKTKTFGCDQTVVCKRVGRLREWGSWRRRDGFGSV